jgi:hypothetical protein
MYTNHKNIIDNISFPLYPKHDTMTSLDIGLHYDKQNFIYPPLNIV